MSTGLLVRCNSCGNEWVAKPQHLLRGHRCRKCALQSRDCSNNKKKTTSQFIDELKHVNDKIEVIGEYISAHRKIKCKCLMCGNIWDAQPANLLYGCGCAKCGYERNKNKQMTGIEKFRDNLLKINPDVIIIGEYAGNKCNVECSCAKCGTTWYAMPTNLLHGTGCQTCSCSHGERAIMLWLDSNGIQYSQQYRFDDLLGTGGRKMPFDFYVQDYNLLIEYQGNYHDKTDRRQGDDGFAIRVLHDKMKKEYAISHDIRFEEIWYYEDVNKRLEEIFT